MRRLRLLTMALSALATLAVATPAQAAEPVNVDVLVCAVLLNGEIEVPRHTKINLRFGWGTESRRQGLKFLVSAKAIAKVDGVKVTQANHYWAMPAKLDEHFWATFWTYPAGKLSNGESMAVRLQVTLRDRVWDGAHWYESGPLFDPRLGCRITAT